MNRQIWCNEVYKAIKNKDKKIVLVAGASSSGKSYSAEVLCNYHKQKAIKATVYSADNYYKGISKTIVEKTLQNFVEFDLYKKQIISAVREVIEFSPFTEKFCDKNYKTLQEKLEKLLGDKAISFCQALKVEFQNINFDEPFAIDFESLTKDLNLITNGKKIIKPDYKFSTGEVSFYKKNIIDCSDYDVFIVEGLYTLRDEVLEKIDNTKVVKTCVDCDLKTLLSRKLNRDIKSGRSTLSPEQTIMSYMTQVMPSYYNYIYPTLSRADFVLSTSITKEELNQKQNSKQIKFYIDEKSLKILENLNLEELYNKQQIDYFFDAKTNKSSNIVVRVREVDNLVSKLTFKSNSVSENILNRQIEEYNLETQLSTQNRQTKNFVSKFLTSGFVLNMVVDKNRKILKYKDITIKLDDVKNLAMFLEFDDLNATALELAKILKLSKVCKNSYYETLLNSKKFTKNTEAEFKFLVSALPDKFDEKLEIVQIYFDHTKKMQFVKALFGVENIDDIDTARIRSIKTKNNQSYFVTIKSKGLFERKEYEKQISKSLYDFLMEDAMSAIHKNRYVVYIDKYKLEFDEYKNKQGLVTCEVEVENKNIKQQYDEIIKIINNLGICAKNITENEKYKNNNLAEKIIEK